MKKIFSIIAASAFVLAASSAFAGSKAAKADGCPGDCQQQIDGLNSSQARQDEQIKANSDRISKQGEDIKALAAAGYNPWYIKGIVKYVKIDDMRFPQAAVAAETDDTGYGIGLAVGRQFGQFRVDGELATQKADVKALHSGDVRFDTAMLNGTYDIPIWQGLSFYGTVGMGVGKVDLTLPLTPGIRVDESETTFAYKAGLGLAYAFTSNMAAEFGYEYLGVSDVNLNGLDVEDLSSNNIVAAFRYSF